MVAATQELQHHKRLVRETARKDEPPPDDEPGLGSGDEENASNSGDGCWSQPQSPLPEPNDIKLDDGKRQDVEKLGQPLEMSNTTGSEKPFSSFTLWEKRLIVSVASLGGFISPLTTNIYFPALNTIAADLNVTITMLNLTITTYMIFQGLAPSFIGSFADTQGRRPAYLIGFAIYIASNIGLALTNSYAGLLVLRCIQSCGSSGMVTLYAAVVADVVTSAERGSYIAYTSMGSVLGPSISPVIGGLLSQHLGWHSIFWFLAIFSGVFGILILAFYPETCRAIVGDGSLPPPTWNQTILGLYKEQRQKRSKQSQTQEAPQPATAVANAGNAKTQAKKRSRIPNPLATLRVCAEKETSLILLIAGLIYAGFYVLTTTVTTQFHAIYPSLNDTQLGLIFLPLALGSVLAALTNGRLLDRNYRRHALRAGLPLQRSKQVDMSNFPIERVRLEIGLPFLSSAAVFFVAYGWLLHFEVHIAGPITLLVFLGYCAFAGFSTLSVLVIDTHRANPATASAALNLVRCLLGAGAAAVANPLIDAVGRGWAFTIVGFVMGGLMPLLVVVMRCGMRWRAEEKRKLEERGKQKEREKEKGEAAQK